LAQRLQAMPAAHPRLLLGRGAEAGLKQHIGASPVVTRLGVDLRREADQELDSPPVE
jgi:hypothetical protein